MTEVMGCLWSNDADWQPTTSVVGHAAVTTIVKIWSNTKNILPFLQHTNENQ